MRKLMLLTTIAVLSACSANPPPPAPADAATATPEAPVSTMPATPTPSTEMPTTPTPMPPADNLPPADAATPAFADKIWRVEGASAVEAGTTYTFRSGGVLVVDAPHGTPMTGSWSYAGGKLTMTEEGIAYPTDIVLLDAGHFTIRSHNPGGSVEIAMTQVPSAM